MTLYQTLFDHGLTRIDAERAHRWAFRAIRAGHAVPGLLALVTAETSHLPRHARHVAEDVTSRRVMGVRFPGPLGLAAGFDKNAVGVPALAAMGFSFVEVGTVTARPQPGNPRPRLFRLPADHAVVNRMGFNNDGAAVVARRLARLRRRHPRGRLVVGVNIGRSKDAEDAEDAEADYRTSAGLLAPYADYLVVNVSSPNTPGLRDLQAVSRLRPLLATVRETADTVAGRPVPLLVKIAPDLADPDVAAVADLVTEQGLAGVVCCNTTVGRDGLVTDPATVDAAGAGGLSGRPLRERSEQMLANLRRRLGPEPTLISVGGVWDAADVLGRLDAGANLVQAYTAFVYQGPRWASRVQREVARRAQHRTAAVSSR